MANDTGRGERRPREGKTRADRNREAGLAYAPQAWRRS